ncbi:hypothetical protein M378DRAFT_12917 [Amanita muscaria Koide BX008]|uniref:Uncharacterized protein n=1 Tax=Amanita muscaria (strain Koide BX008) TaxID=946122 RepID=A0A0C2T6W7_AMAMK|nr:hypothetical protein M378DRAFT_12917 [Amanita muscaria Koide BX008]
MQALQQPTTRLHPDDTTKLGDEQYGLTEGTGLQTRYELNQAQYLEAVTSSSSAAKTSHPKTGQLRVTVVEFLVDRGIGGVCIDEKVAKQFQRYCQNKAIKLNTRALSTEKKVYLKTEAVNGSKEETVSFDILTFPLD